MSSSNMKNPINIALVVIGLVLVGLAAKFYMSQSFGSPVGSTFNSAKVAAINITPSSASASTTSILNTDASDRIVTDGFASCSGLGTSFTPVTGGGLLSAGFGFYAGTTSASGANIPQTTRGSDFAMNISVATTTASDAYTATTTYTLPYTRRWASGSYMTFAAIATNTAACNVGVHYLAI